MFNSVVLDVTIGLIFIFLLYSLLATIVSELIATVIGLRARNLKEAVNRMLNDEETKTAWGRFVDTLKLTKNPKNKVIDDFYNHPEIKYLGSSGIFQNPSSFKAVSFSKTLLNVFFSNEPLTRELIDARLSEILRLAKAEEKATAKIEQVSGHKPDQKVLDPDTARYIQMLWTDSNGDVAKFKFQLETWFDRTMEQATEWYKRKIQVILLILGFLIAWVFNADTLVIVDRLSNDKDAREMLVDMATAYLQDNKTMVDTSKIRDKAELKTYSERLDSLLKIKNDLDADIAKANTILGLGSWPSDKVLVSYDRKSNARSLTPALDYSAIPNSVIERAGASPDTFEFTTAQKWRYFFNLFPIHFFGFLVTAFAISLGAPFWFDMLNKIMKLRTSQKVESSSPNTSTGKESV